MNAAPHPWPAFDVVNVLDFHLTGVVWYLPAVLIYSSLMTYDVEHHSYAYSSSSHTHASALVRCLFRSFAHMLIRLFIFLLLSFMSSVFDNGYQICLWQIFLPSLWLLFSLSWLIFNFVSSDHNFIVTFILIQSNVEIILLYRAPFSFF